MALNFLLMLVLVFLFVLSAFLLVRSWRRLNAMEEIPGNLGWPIVGESFSFISEFGSPAGICSFMIKRQKRYQTSHLSSSSSNICPWKARAF